MAPIARRTRQSTAADLAAGPAAPPSPSSLATPAPAATDSESNTPETLVPSQPGHRAAKWDELNEIGDDAVTFVKQFLHAKQPLVARIVST